MGHTAKTGPARADRPNRQDAGVLNPSDRASAPQPAFRSRRFRTIIKRLLLRGTLGCVAALGIAWTSVVVSHNHRMRSSETLINDPSIPDHPFHGRLIGNHRRSTGVSHIVLLDPEDEIGRSILLIFTDDPTQVTKCEEIGRLPMWARRQAPASQRFAVARSVGTYAAGFPFRMVAAIHASYELQSTSIYAPPTRDQVGMSCPVRFESTYQDNFAPASRTVRWGAWSIRPKPHGVTRWLNRQSRLPEYLPLTPIWPGFLANTAIYTAIIWALFWSVAFVRRWRHPTAVPCPKCRYDLAGIDTDRCPECGAPIAPGSSSLHRRGSVTK
ncbi:MAG: zf-TFIIB domain-containing protein [Phycisphaerales bacterium]